MASLDFAYDMAEKLADDKFEYMIVTIKPGKKRNKVNIFHRLTSKKSCRMLSAVLEKIQEELHS